jgi:hypothetical protein
MNKRYLPSLIIFAKGMMITALGILFKFLDKGESNILFGIGGFLIFASLVVLLVMHWTKPKNL